MSRGVVEMFGRIVAILNVPSCASPDRPSVAIERVFSVSVVAQILKIFGWRFAHPTIRDVAAKAKPLPQNMGSKK
ncbi:hypothetical protein GCM10025771_34170 [Niveibacterium umoris]